MPSAKRRAQAQVPLDELGEPAATERAQRGVDREAARATRELRYPVHLVANGAAVVLDQIGRADRHSRTMCFRIGAEDERRVVGDVQPLVGVRDPGIRPLDAVDEMTKTRARTRPETESTVDVQPRTVRSNRIGDLVEGIECSGVHLARLRADDRRPVSFRQRRTQSLGVQPSLPVGGHDLGQAEAEQAERTVDRDVALRADEHANARCSGETVPPDIPAHALEHAEARGSKRRDASHLGAGDETERGVLRQPEQIAHPLAHHLFDDGRRRAAHVEARVLIPGGGQPVRGERRGQATADDEAEVPPARYRHDSLIRGRDQALHDVFRSGRLVRQRPAERLTELVDRCLREDWPVVERLEEVRGKLCGSSKKRADVAHELDSTRRITPCADRRASSSSS